jgi:putative membrane protein
MVLLTKNDRRARSLIYAVSAVVFIAVVLLGRVKLEVDLGFDVHFLQRSMQ